jgi:hypothetical protein
MNNLLAMDGRDTQGSTARLLAEQTPGRLHPTSVIVELGAPFSSPLFLVAVDLLL